MNALLWFSPNPFGCELLIILMSMGGGNNQPTYIATPAPAPVREPIYREPEYNQYEYPAYDEYDNYNEY